MDTMSAFLRAEANKGQRFKVFDWKKAAELIRDKKPRLASAGLGRDWEHTGGVIYDGKPVMDGGTYLCSNWAIPELDMDDHVVDCWIYQDESPGWDSQTVWPESALEILNAQ